jgi:ABC-2 type transport system ATP-binding protein
MEVSQFMLRLIEVSKQFRGTDFLLHKLSFNLGKGMHMLIGPNGAGKSTLLRIIATVIRPDTGDISFNGWDVYSDLPRYKFGLGYLPQVSGFYDHMTGKEFLRYIAGLKGIDHRRVQERTDYVTELLRIQQHCTRKISTWSVGQRQRLGLAQALLGDPDILVLDEPFGGLDLEEAEAVGQLLVRLSQDKVVLISSHIMEGLAVNGLLFLVDGHLQFTGSLTTFLDKAQGQVWSVETSKEQWFKLQHEYLTSTAIFKDGRCRCKIICEYKPDIPGAKAIAPGLEDAYIFWLQYCKQKSGKGLKC